MNKIEFPRIGADGNTYTNDIIKQWYIDEIETKINEKLLAINKTQKNRKILEYVINNLNHILLAEPQDLLNIIKELSKHKPLLFTKKGAKSKINKEIYKAFGYEAFRKTTLVELAAKLNVKTCPYCNMHYTLYAEKEPSSKKEDKLAKMQFDHFFDKKEHPYLSMSLYNLIPSCGVCNQGKSTGSLPLEFHPYESNIHKLFRFEIENPLIQLYGGKADKIKVKLKAISKVPQPDIDNFANMFNLIPLYSRHRDIAQETFDKAYEDPYYTNPANFSWLCSKDPGYIQRLWLGTYVSKDEIEKRPMTKFIQDLWEQAQDIKIKSRIFEP